jgi:hypothetical protein
MIMRKTYDIIAVRVLEKFIKTKRKDSSADLDYLASGPAVWVRKKPKTVYLITRTNGVGSVERCPRWAGCGKGNQSWKVTEDQRGERTMEQI